MEENSDFQFDIDEQNRVRGIEIFGETYNLLKEMQHVNKFILIDGKHYWGKEKTIITYDVLYQGIILHFQNADYTNFVGLTIMDTKKYPAEYLGE
ncbi:hypothetical protein [Rummeliibacillus suwonensis]|uniref:hypothetical protein n=1 Tax=Rummeliibacillus suwonensis TaxID=1306154 RepID=UPI0011B379FC|nr:hypothetical protein [Rummeliibacillus suwonensis]MBO2536968.1 hypothetical protein [Rummeliibacillus suwonensis]